MTRIVIADDHAVVRKGLRLILADTDGLQVAGEASSVSVEPRRTTTLPASSTMKAVS